MSECKEFLKELEYYCMEENGLEKKKDKNRSEYNLKRIMNEFKQQKNDESIKARYDANIDKAKQLVEEFDIVHNTGVDNIISILQNDAILSIDEMEKRDISFNFRITYKGINDEMHKYVFGATHKGDPIYGLYEIRFKRDVETISNTSFMPKSYLEYGEEVIKDYILSIKDWRTYLAEYIAINFETPEDYLNVTPVHLRPEFLFPDQIPVSYFDSIVCINEQSYNQLVNKVKEEFGETSEILQIIKIASE